MSWVPCRCPLYDRHTGKEFLAPHLETVRGVGIALSHLRSVAVQTTSRCMAPGPLAWAAPGRHGDNRDLHYEQQLLDMDYARHDSESSDERCGVSVGECVVALVLTRTPQALEAGREASRHRLTTAAQKCGNYIRLAPLQALPRPLHGLPRAAHECAGSTTMCNHNTCGA